MDSSINQKTISSTIVLTFDDGPLPPDVRDPAVTASDEDLLIPLREILHTLQTNHAQAVFYLVGPDDTQNTPAFRQIYRQGIQEMLDGGHILGYHAYHHTQNIWIEPGRPFIVAQAVMNKDMDELSAFLDQILAMDHLTRQEIMTPIFRQPYGGGGVSQGPAISAAARHGWFYHGFRIDSADWTGNVDAAPEIVNRLPVITDAEHVAFVLRQLEMGSQRNANRSVVDVLFHVNHFTARHLQEWIDALNSQFASQAGEPSYSVPQQYLDQSDSYADPSVTDFAFGLH